MRNLPTSREDQVPLRSSLRSANQQRYPMMVREKTPALQKYNGCIRVMLIIFALFFTISALILTIVAIFLPNWLYLDIEEYQQHWKIGLVEYCRRGGNENEVGLSNQELNSWICDLKTDFKWGTSTGTHQQGHDSFDDNKNGEMTVFVLLCIANTFGMGTLFSICCAYFNKFVPVYVTVSSLVSAGCSIFAIGLFTITMQNADNRRYTSFDGVYFEEVGPSLYIAAAGALSYGVTFLLSLPLAFVSFVQTSNQRPSRV